MFSLRWPRLNCQYAGQPGYSRIERAREGMYSLDTQFPHVDAGTNIVDDAQTWLEGHP